MPTTPQQHAAALGPIPQRLRALRRSLRAWLWTAGLARLAAPLLAFVGASFAADRLLRFDRPQRTVLLALAVAGLAYVAWRRLLRRLRVRLSDEQLCEAVEMSDPSVRSRLRTALELARRPDLDAMGYSPALVEATVADGVRAAERAGFRGILNRSLWWRHVRILAGTVVLLAGWNAAFPRTASLWFKRNILLSADTWPQRTHLVVPGLRDGRLVVPEGGDLEVLIEARGRAPALVTVDVREGRRRSSEQLVRVGDRRFRWTIARVLQNLQFRVRGGDATTEWFAVQVLPRPRLAAIVFRFTPPAYTGLPPRDLPTQESSLEVLEGGLMTITGSATKPLERVTCIPTRADVVTADLTGPDAFTLNLAADNLDSGVYVLELLDNDGLTSRPSPRFTLRVLPDRPPDVKLKLNGIGEMITPRARVPFSAFFRDDFAVTNAVLIIQPTEQDQPPLQQPLGTFAGCRGPEPHEHAHVLEVEPLKLEVDRHLVFLVEAEDNNAYKGAGKGKSNTISLRVVPPEVLRYELMRREENLRRGFEALLEEQKGLLEKSREMAASADALPENWKSELRAAEKRQRRAGRKTEATADHFDQVIDELINNRLEDEDSPIRKRIKQSVTGPLRDLSATGIPAAADRLAEALPASLEPEPRGRVLLAAAAEQEKIVATMTTVLQNMHRFEGYQAAVTLLKKVIKAHEDASEATKKAQEDLIRRLLGGGEE